VLEVVCWKWKPVGQYRSTFGPNTVNVLRRMIARHLTIPHRFTCVTDDWAGIDDEVRIVDINSIASAKYARVPNPSNIRNPSCYRRLFLFSEEAREVLGEKVVSMDLDMVVVGDLTPLFDRDVDFMIWGGQTVQPHSITVYNWFNGSLMMHKPGTRTRVWTDFDPATSPAKANGNGCRGSDQGWIAHCLGRSELTWGQADGVYSYRNHVLTAGGRLAKNARIVAFHGQYDPWMRDVQSRHAWVREHYR
jgi:hypothetical protein